MKLSPMSSLSFNDQMKEKTLEEIKKYDERKKKDGR